MSLLSRLCVLLAVTLLPATLIQIYDEFELHLLRQIEIQNQALTLAKLVGEEQQQMVQGIRELLVAMAELPSIKAKDTEACNAYLITIGSRFPAFTTFLVTDLNGVSFCDTNSDHRPINIAGRKYFATALKTGAFTVGEFSAGLSTGRRVIQFVLPFYGTDGRMGGVIVAALSLDWVGGHIGRKRLPEGAALGITDRNGVYLARYPGGNSFVGKKMPGGDPRVDDRAVDVVDVDGVERIECYSALGEETGGIVVSVGLNKAQAFSSLQRRTRNEVIPMILSTALIFGLAWLGARRFIYRPFSQLVDAANQWRFGKYDRRVEIRDKSEISYVADAFNAMAEALGHRERELSQAKERAEDAAARITMIFESTTDSVLIVDRNWRISYLNGPARSLLAEGRDIINQGLREALLDDLDADIFNRVAETVSDGRPASFEVLWARRSIWCAINAFPSGDGIAIFCRDITEHKQALEARRVMQEQLHQSQKMEAVGQLTGGIAHDFNNLLTVVSANLELIDRAADNGKIRWLAENALRAVDRGAKLTAQLLAFSRRQKLNPKLINANELISEFQSLIRQAVGGGCEVRLKTDERLWLCYVDPALFETALLNLALNGRDAMPNGGVLEIETRNVALDEGAVDECSPGPYVRVSVTDSGCGIAPDVLSRIFEPFFTTKEVGKGTGLGLSMVYGFVRKTGGHVTAESTLGKGTTIALHLPKAGQDRSSEIDGARTRVTPRGSERVLVVEDNEELLEAASEMLTMFGYHVLCARNGVEALRTLERDQNVELLFSDVVLPNGTNGVELARAAKRLNKNIKILLTSGYAGDVLERLRSEGEFPIIDKPFQLADLAKRLRSILDSN
jgi:signal transduction histidine kinase